MKDIVISLRDVWLKYRIEFKEEGGAVVEDFLALKGINLTVARGDAVCLIGENGAGKTSLLKIIAGMFKPDKGAVEISGRVSGLMDIGTGFHKELTGRENIYLISYLYGLSKNDIDKRCKDIMDFASLGRFISAPMKSYSQGMYMRLAFAIAIHMDPDILLIDDTFAVGDIYTQRKCINKIFELKEKGKTIILVTHDMEMARRICVRGVFLREGDIIKDGRIDKVCVYYAETVGDKKGIAILQEGPLGLIFNNGRLILRWRDNTVTSNLSGHTGTFFAGWEYLSTAAEWRVTNLKKQKGFIAIGRWHDTHIRQCWRVFSLSEKEFFWEISMRTPGELLPEQVATRVIFDDEYKSYFSLNGEDNFPDSFLHGEQWQLFLVEHPANTAVGLKNNNNADADLPIITFDRSQDNRQVLCHVGNTGSEIKGRVIQYMSFPNMPDSGWTGGKYNRCFLSKINIFEAQESGELKSYLESVQKIVQESKIIRKGPISIFCKEHRIEIYSHDRLLTPDAGLHTQFRYKDKDYSSSYGNWHIRKENDAEIMIIISWEDGPPFKQLWRLKLEGDGVIFWNVLMEVVDEVKIRNKQAEASIAGEYEEWIADEEKGDLRKADRKGSATLSKYTNKFIGVGAVYKKDRVILPRIVFDLQDGMQRISYIIRSGHDISTIKLQYVEIDSKDNPFMRPGTHIYFSGKIRVAGGEEGLERLRIEQNPDIVQKHNERRIELGDLALVFDCGKGRLFWRGAELTKGLGLYSSIFLKDRWQDSSQASWEIRVLDKTRLSVVGRWPWTPLIQTWDMFFLEENVLLWKITKEIWEEIVLEREQVNLMVSDKYKEWFVYKKASGKFPDKFTEHNGLFWDRLWCGDSTLPIGIRRRKHREKISGSQSMPSVIFNCPTGCGARYSVIENTDSLFCARILQYELTSNGTGIHDMDKKQYFEGRIEVATD